MGSPVSFKVRNRDRNLEGSKNDLDVVQRKSRSRFQPYVSNRRTDSPTGQRHRGYQSLERPGPDRRTDRGQSSRSLQDKEPSGSRDNSYLKLSQYSFNISFVELVSARKNIKEVMFQNQFGQILIRGMQVCGVNSMVHMVIELGTAGIFVKRCQLCLRMDILGNF